MTIIKHSFIALIAALTLAGAAQGTPNRPVGNAEDISSTTVLLAVSNDTGWG